MFSKSSKIAFGLTLSALLWLIIVLFLVLLLGDPPEWPAPRY